MDYYEGWALLNEVIGILSIYTVNMMYSLNSLTLLMSSKKLTANLSESIAEVSSEDGEDRSQKYPIYMRIRNGILYLLIPFCMLFSVFGELAFTPGWCIASRSFSLFCNLFSYLLLLYCYLTTWLESRRELEHPVPAKVRSAVT
jgi:hypothetical protein